MHQASSPPAGAALHPFDADQPISTLEADLLGRRAFAERLGHSIRAWHGQESLVIAVYAGWGDGKTSFKRMVVSALREDETSCPIITEFNPWEWSGQQQVATAFFEEIGKQLHTGDGAGKAATPATRETGRLFRALGRTLHVVGKVAVPVAKAGPALLEWFTTGGYTGQSQVATAVATTVAKPLGEGAAALGDALQTLGEVDGPPSAPVEQSLSQTKAELKQALSKLDRGILVVLDDVDRLEPSEVRLLFQLVKANADFPRLIFLLLFQRETVEACLDTPGNPGSGIQYLQKIIQVGFDLPEMPRRVLEDFLRRELTGHLTRLRADAAFDRERWEVLYRSLLAPHFKNFRAVKRFLNTFAFYLSAFARPMGTATGTSGTRTILEVNPVDLFAVEALRTFEPAIYEALIARKEFLLFANDPDSSMSARLEDFADRILATEAAHATLTDKQVEDRRLALAAFFAELFAPDRSSFGLADGKGGVDPRLRKPEYFDRYFEVSIAHDDVGNGDMEQLIACVNDQTAFLSLLKDWRAQSRIEAAARRLVRYLDATDRTQLILAAILRVNESALAPDEHAAVLPLAAALVLHDSRSANPISAPLLLDSPQFVIPVHAVNTALTAIRQELQTFGGYARQIVGEDRCRWHHNLARNLAKRLARQYPWASAETGVPPLLVRFVQRWAEPEDLSRIPSLRRQPQTGP